MASSSGESVGVHRASLVLMDSLHANVSCVAHSTYERQAGDRPCARQQTRANTTWLRADGAAHTHGLAPALMAV